MPRKTSLLIYNDSAGLTDRMGEIEAGVRLLEEDGATVLKQPVQAIGSKEAFLKFILDNHIATVISAGGDGTLNTVANLIVDTDVRLAIIPGGTFNHFAKHIGIPPLVIDAFKTIIDGETVRIDTAEVNGRVFVNFSSVGFYVDAIKRRIEYQKRGWKKFRALVPAIMKALLSYKLYELSVQARERGITKHTPLVFIGNNEFVFSGPDFLFDRESFISGRLHVSFFPSIGRLRLLKTVATIFLKKPFERTFSTILIDTLKVASKSKKVSVSLDGEIVDIDSPLTYRTKPRSLSVIVPRHEKGNIQSLRNARAKAH